MVRSVSGTVGEVAEIMASNCEKLKLQKQRRLDTCLDSLIPVYYEDFYYLFDIYDII